MARLLQSGKIGDGKIFVTELSHAIRVTLGIRVAAEHEYEGVDLSECGLEACPEFTSAD